MGTVAAGTAPTFVIVHPTGKFAYTANANVNTVSLYTRDTTTGILVPAVDIPAGTTSRSLPSNLPVISPTLPTKPRSWRLQLLPGAD